MRAKKWVVCWFAAVLLMLGAIALCVYGLDPFFHYHAPRTDKYYYTLDNERSQNDGIVKYFDYDALIAGTSMTENFKASEMDAIFGTHTIKVPISGGTYKEINDTISTALHHNPKLKTVVRCLDMFYFFDHKDNIRTDLGFHPTYLYDKNPFNDVQYVFNHDIIQRLYEMCGAAKAVGPGIDSFDSYGAWQKTYPNGSHGARNYHIDDTPPAETRHLTDEERATIYANIEQNVTSLAREYPDVDFYYYFTPYSTVWWSSIIKNGTFCRQLEAERYIIELILPVENIHLYSFNTKYDITTDLNHYADLTHHAEWVNSAILQWLHDGEGLLTRENYMDYLREEEQFYSSYDYLQINSQPDYEFDLFADIAFRGLTPTPLPVFEAVLYNAELDPEYEDGNACILCRAARTPAADDADEAERLMLSDGHRGAVLTVDNAEDYKYIAFSGRGVSGCPIPAVLLTNAQGETIGKLFTPESEADGKWHQYLLDISELKGPIQIILGAVSHSSGSEFAFAEIELY